MRFRIGTSEGHDHDNDTVMCCLGRSGGGGDTIIILLLLCQVDRVDEIAELLYLAPCLKLATILRPNMRAIYASIIMTSYKLV